MKSLNIHSPEDKGMTKQNVNTKLKKCRSVYYFIFIPGALALLLSVAAMSKFLSFKSFLGTESSYSNLNLEDPYGNENKVIMITVEIVIQKIEQQMEKLRETKQDSSSSSSSFAFQQASFLADILGLLESAATPHQHNEGNNQQNGSFTTHPLVRKKKQSDEPADYFLREEIRKYVRIKPNRLGKQNFMGANASFTSIGHACFAMKEELEEYMDYDVGEICNDDWKLAQKLMVHGCDPLPRRRCFSRAPKLYNQPFPITESLWKLPDDRNVRWSQYRCKNFACLAGNTTGKGFFKCAHCFNLTNHEKPRWMSLESDSNQTAEFLISDVLAIKPGEIRMGLDFSVGTGTFAARMREFNVTIVSATINFGAPFSEMIALRGLVPLYFTINQRLPFFDNTLDLIHTTRFLDGWIDFVLLEFILYDWDRVLRPGGLLWIDSFFCLKEDLYDYLQAFKMLRYKKLKWVVVPKLDKDDQEMFFSAVLEKPPRPFR
ncbi:S-adenosyl-L-methionine-dependent methyltransferase [Vigna unguiculata]|uniref:S-adenosyl-L-methionine-dependent methyltransferase n=1 Tax=Vigna unguiculata TaxID=3917 RepID=A0A4D6MPQ8_VIGUN|nr:S-adenosyl-L-methionine-dependent methyltransferase [Vigna unguiculata]